jgi:predicted ABC-type sugar transport system permease subunit
MVDLSVYICGVGRFPSLSGVYIFYNNETTTVAFKKTYMYLVNHEKQTIPAVLFIEGRVIIFGKLFCY